jgi:hypothetical protein
MSTMTLKTKIIHLNNLIEMLALSIMLFGEGLANRSDATTQLPSGI